jgi:hypothetical protein
LNGEFGAEDLRDEYLLGAKPIRNGRKIAGMRGSSCLFEGDPAC